LIGSFDFITRWRRSLQSHSVQYIFWLTGSGKTKILFFIFRIRILYYSIFLYKDIKNLKLSFFPIFSHLFHPPNKHKKTVPFYSYLTKKRKRKKHHSYNFFFNSSSIFHPSIVAMPNWELKNCCDHDQKLFIVFVGVYTVVILLVTTSFSLNPFFILVLKWKT
jgi:hypothetical protein